MTPTIDRLRTTTMLLALLALACSTATAQERRLPPFVLALGAEYDIASGILANTDNNRNYDQRVRLRQASVGFVFPKLFMNGWGLAPTITYGDIDLSASAAGDRTVYIGSAPTTGTTMHDYRLVMRTMTLELMSHVHIVGNARLELGPIGGLAFFPEIDETERILGPTGATFSDGSTERRDSTSVTDEGLVITGFGLRVGYEIPIPGGMALMPSVNLRGLVGLSTDGDDVVVGGSAGLGLSLLTGRTGGEEIEPVPVGIVDTIRVVDTVAPASRLKAELDLYSIDSAGRRSDTLVVALRRTLRRVEVPLETLVRFEPSSAAMPATAIASASDAAAFTEEELVALSPAQVRRRSLDVVGARMRDDRSLRLTLVGSRRRDEPAWFAEARSRSVRRHLQTVWGVDSARVTIARGETLKGDAMPAVRMSTTTVRTLAAVESEWIEQEVDAAPVAVTPTIVADAGVQSWRVSVMQGTREVGVVRNTDGADARLLDIGMALRRLTREEARHALGAELVAEDSSGAVVVARDRMEVIVTGGRGVSGDASAESIVAEYALPVGDSAASRRAIERLVVTLPARARVVVVAPVGLDAEVAGLERRLREAAAARGVALGTIEHALPERGGQEEELVVVRVSAAL